MKKKLVSSILMASVAMTLVTGCGEKEDDSKNLIEPTETAGVLLTETPEATPTEILEVTPTEFPEVTPTEAPETIPTETQEIIPTETLEVTPTETPEMTPTQIPTVTPTSAPAETSASLTKEEAEQLLLERYGMEDASTGYLNSFGYENTVTIDGVQYYNFRWSWLVVDHVSYVTNLVVALDGSGIYEATYDENRNLELVK